MWQYHIAQLCHKSLPDCVSGPGVLYLQYGEETKQVRMPVEIGSHDTLRALFVTAFPQQLTMKMLQSPNMAIYIKDTSRNVYYDLEDIRWGTCDPVGSHDHMKFTNMQASYRLL